MKVRTDIRRFLSVLPAFTAIGLYLKFRYRTTATTAILHEVTDRKMFYSQIQESVSLRQQWAENL